MKNKMKPMEKISRLEDLRLEARRFNLYVNKYAPGDGATRYRFSTEPKGYFEDYGIFTALGVKEARVFLRGVEVGISMGAPAHKNKKGVRVI